MDTSVTEIVNAARTQLGVRKVNKRSSVIAARNATPARTQLKVIIDTSSVVSQPVTSATEVNLPEASFTVNKLNNVINILAIDSIVERLSDGWNETFGRTVTHYTSENEWPSAASSDAETKRLGMWVSAQRHKYKKGLLSPERVALLESVDGWLWEVNLDDVWNETFGRTVAHYTSENEWPSVASSDAETKRLGIWINTQRRQYKKGLLSPERVALLESVDGWVWGQDDVWNETFGRAVAHYTSENEWPSVASSSDAETKRLGKWVDKQRQQYKKGLLSPERVALLESVDGWLWGVKLDDVWNETFGRTVTHYTSKNEWPSRDSSDAETKRLGKWVNKQRQQYKKGLLSPERVALLESVDGWVWEVNLDDVWNETFGRAVAHYTSENEWPSRASSDAETKRLGVWISAQRHKYKKGLLSPERVALLESVDGWLWGVNLDDVWNETFGRAVTHYTSENEWPSVASSDAETKRLGKWVSAQRHKYKKGLLSSERVALLESVDGWLWRAR
jgi:hypothetical protein